MRKALTVSAFAVTAAMAIAAPATAFAADAPQAPSASASAPDAQVLSVSPSKTEAKPGDVVKLALSGPKLTDVRVSSDALVKTSSFQNLYVQGTVKDGASGSYTITVSGKGADGNQYSANATVVVDGKTPASSGTVAMSPDHAAPGAKVAFSVKIGPGTPPQGVSIKSDAFGGQAVALTKGQNGVWTGSAVVAKVKDGDYGVAAVSNIPGTKALATGSFKVTRLAPVTQRGEVPATPLAPSQHVTPKGSVNTGMAPVGSSTGTADLAAGGIAAAGAAALLGLTLRSRRNGA
ncbi:hypothetical protein [Streptomyces sp. NPDC059918]|uniref:hypothetical protein n=1 Tax=unclassified Streptomyces TaxID=2593676 RepID=UPI00364B755A